MTKSILDPKSMSDGMVVDLAERETIRVLHVDDDSVFLKVAKQCLEIEGRFQVDTALSVQEAMEKMKKEMYDAVVSDYVMHGKDGLNFLKELRDAGNNIPFIMFTGKGSEEIAIKALNLGANGYFSKIGSPKTVYGELAHGMCQIMESKRAEEALRTNESYLKPVFDSISTGLILIDEETHKIVDANSHALETIDASREDVIGKVCHKFICSAEEGKCPITDLDQIVDRSERVLLRADGKRVPILKTVTRIIWRGRKYLVESIVDITERKKAEKTLQKPEERFGTLMEEVPIAICNTDLKGKITYVNKRFEEYTGYSREEIVGKDGFKLGIISDETLKLLAKRMKARLVGKPSRLLEGRFKRKDGEWIWAEVEGRLIKKFGVPDGFQLAARDITERKRAEKERRRFEESLSALNTYGRNLNMAESLEGIYELTLDAAEKTLGFRFADILIIEGNMLRIVNHRGRSKDLSAELPLDGGRGITVRAAKTGKSVFVPDISREEAYVEFGPDILSELAVPIKIGDRVLGVLNAESKKLNAFNEKDQELLEILASHAATAMSRLEYSKSLETYAHKIRETQEKFERLFLNSPEAAVYMDSDFHILDVNPRFIELFGYSLSEVKSKHIDDVVVPKDKMEEAKMLAEEFMKGPVYYDTVRQRKDGTLVPVSISGAPIIVEGRLIGTVGLYKDISQLKKTEKAIRESQQMFERLFMDNPEAAVHLDPSFHILNANPRFMRLFGYSLDEIKGKHINDVIVPRDKMEEAVVFDERARKGETYHEDTVRKRKDGSLVPVAFSAAPIIVENQVIGHIAVYKDISQLKKAEEELRETLEKLGKMNEKLRVVGGLTRHDARNKLSVITGNVYLARKKLAGNNEVLNNLKEVESAVAQIVRIFDFAKTYEMLGVEELRFIDVEEIVNEAVSLFSDLNGVKVINNCRGLTVLADSLLAQLFYNLIDNSLKYGEKTKTITMYHEETDKDRLKLVYEDDGVGIAEEEKKKLFQEGYGKGTGYGLYLIRKMCEGHGWDIQETGKEGAGAQFTITIPRIGEKRRTNYSVS